MEQNWRAGLAQDSRNKIVSRIMDTLQRQTPMQGPDGMTQLWRIANRFEEKIFYAASDQHDYLRKVSLKMLKIRTQFSLALPTSSSGTNERPLDSGITDVQAWQQVVQPVQAGMFINGIQGSGSGEPASSFFSSSVSNIPQPTPVMNALGQVSGNLPALNDGSLSNSTIVGQAPSQNLHSQAQLQLQQYLLQNHSQGQAGSGDSFQQVGQPGIDEADLVWSKMQTLKDKYLPDMRELYNMLDTRSKQHMPEDQLQKLRHYTNVLQRMMPYLIASKGSLPKEFKQDKVEAFEKQVVSIMETFKRRKQVAPQSQQPQQQANLGQVQAVQQPEQASQILHPGNKPVQQQTPQTNSSLTAPTELQPDNPSSPFLQFSATSLQGVVTQSTPLSSLANAVRLNVPEMQQDQQFHQNRSLKEEEQSKWLQLLNLQQYQRKHLQLFYVFFCMLIFTFYLLFVFCGSMTT